MFDADEDKLIPLGYLKNTILQDKLSGIKLKISQVAL
jgi:hypothetical protein